MLVQEKQINEKEMEKGKKPVKLMFLQVATQKWKKKMDF